MKKCPYCAEEIRDEAVKCRFCGEFLIRQPPASPWYFKTSILVVGFLTVGPFVLPLLWWNPKYSRTTKILVTVLILLVTYLLAVASIESWKHLKSYYDQITELLKG